ncbi:efflux RND transporter periplasmic adaptor subunit [Parapedomonas caeni]
MLTDFTSRFRQLSPRTRWLTVGVAGIVVASGVAMMANSSAPEPGAGEPEISKGGDAQGVVPRVTVIVPGASTRAAQVTVTGTIAARYDMPVGVEGESGRLAAVLVEAGDRVAKGQLLARLNTDLLKPQVAQLAAALEEARANARLARADYERVKAIAESGAVAKEEIDRRKATAETAAARAKVVEAQLNETTARLRRAEIRAPEAGVVLERMAELGQTATMSTPLFRLAKDGQVELRGEVAEQDMPKLAEGQAATVTITGIDRTFTGKVWLVGAVIDPKTRLGSVRVALTPDPQLRPGAFARGVVTTGATSKPVLPQSAVQADGQGSYVYIVGDDNRTERRDVKVTATVEQGLVIGAGLTGDEKVVASAGAFLRTGELIIPILDGKPLTRTATKAADKGGKA